MSTLYTNIVEVETLMRRLDVTIYDLETVDHVRSLVDDDDPGYTLSLPELVERATTNVDQNDLAKDYEYLQARQSELIQDALQPWRAPDADDDEDESTQEAA